MEERTMKFAIACGGTGGHLFPGLAVALELRRRGHEVRLIVSEKAIDATALKNHPEFRAEKLPSIGMPSVVSPAFIRFLRRLWESTSICSDLFRKFRPDAVLGMGGFTSTPPVLAARKLRIPRFVHESNAIPGKANRFAARFCTRVLVGFEESAGLFAKGDCVFTGTPVRETLGKKIDPMEARKILKLDPDRKTLLVMGGSQGAAGINQLMFRIAAELARNEFQVIHLAGERDERLAAANYLRDSLPAYVTAFHERMEEVFSAADLVVSRAGASSLNEISYFGLPSVLVPYPFAADNHQEANGNIFVRRGAAEMMIESESTAEKFGTLVTNLLLDDVRRKAMGDAASGLQPKDAAVRVAELLIRESAQ